MFGLGRTSGDDLRAYEAVPCESKRVRSARRRMPAATRRKGGLIADDRRFRPQQNRRTSRDICVSTAEKVGVHPYCSDRGRDHCKIRKTMQGRP